MCWAQSCCFCRGLLAMWRLKALGHNPRRRFKERYWEDFGKLDIKVLVSNLNQLEVTADKVEVEVLQDMADSQGAENANGCDAAHSFSEMEIAEALEQAPEPYRSCFERMFFYIIFQKPSSAESQQQPEPWVRPQCLLSHGRTDLNPPCERCLKSRSIIVIRTATM